MPFGFHASALKFKRMRKGMFLSFIDFFVCLEIISVARGVEFRNRREFLCNENITVFI